MAYIILIMQQKNFAPIEWLEDLCVCDKDGSVIVFDSLDEADYYKEAYSIDGRIVELPLY